MSVVESVMIGIVVITKIIIKKSPSSAMTTHSKGPFLLCIDSVFLFLFRLAIYRRIVDVIRRLGNDILVVATGDGKNDDRQADESEVHGFGFYRFVKRSYYFCGLDEEFVVA
jgi:hypothetical protein